MRGKRRKAVCRSSQRTETLAALWSRTDTPRQRERSWKEVLGRSKQVCSQSFTLQTNTQTQRQQVHALHLCCVHISTGHTPWYVKPSHLYVQYPSLSKQLRLCVFAWKILSVRGVKMKAAWGYALDQERERSAVRSRLCDKPQKSQTSGWVKQPTAHYERKKEAEAEEEAGNNICLVLLLYFHLHGSISSYSDLLIHPLWYLTCANHAQCVLTSRIKNKYKKGGSPVPPISPLWIGHSGTVFLVQPWFLSPWEPAIKQTHYSSR